MNALPLQNPPSSHYGKGGGGGPQRIFDKASTVEVEQKKKKKGRMANEEDQQPPSIKLGLGICAKIAQNPVTKHGKAALTPAQLHELQEQALIYRHIESGLPVPLQLVIPIWKSVSTYFGPAIYEQYPSFVGVFSPQGFDYRAMVDPEPGRCRRTDGKKWRCSRNVIPDQKYCERHIHRGRQRSRKPVETFEFAFPKETMPPNKLNDKLGELNTNSANSAAVSLQLMSPSSTKTDISHDAAATTTTTAISFNVSRDTTTTRISIPIIAATTTTATAAMRTTTTPASADTLTANSNNKIDRNTDRKGVRDNRVSSNTAMKRSGNRINNIGVGIRPGLDFSPKSVLQVQGCSSSCYANRNGIEIEPGRCRRTDGKKWRCSREVIPDQKYCVQHMHRGAKKRVAAVHTLSVSTASSAASHRAPPPPSTNILNKADGIIPNTNLSISIQASPQPDEKMTTSSSSDTTITDTSITANEYGYVSS